MDTFGKPQTDVYWLPVACEQGRGVQAMGLKSLDGTLHGATLVDQSELEILTSRCTLYKTAADL